MGTKKLRKNEEKKPETWQTAGLPTGELHKPAEVANYLGVSPKTVYRWCEMGILEAYKINRSLRITHDSLVGLLGRKKHTSKNVTVREVLKFPILQQ